MMCPMSMAAHCSLLTIMVEMAGSSWKGIRKRKMNTQRMATVPKNREV